MKKAKVPIDNIPPEAVGFFIAMALGSALTAKTLEMQMPKKGKKKDNPIKVVSEK